MLSPRALFTSAALIADADEQFEHPILHRLKSRRPINLKRILQWYGPLETLYVLDNATAQSALDISQSIALDCAELTLSLYDQEWDERVALKMCLEAFRAPFECGFAPGLYIQYPAVRDYFRAIAEEIFLKSTLNPHRVETERLILLNAAARCVGIACGGCIACGGGVWAYDTAYDTAKCALSALRNSATASTDVRQIILRYLV